MPRHHFALVDATGRFSGSDVHMLREFIEANARHCAEVWGLQVPGVDSINDVAHLPEWMTPVVFVDGGEKGKLAVHTYDPLRGVPSIRVYAEKTSGLFSGQHSMLECAGHEVLEAMVNPMVNLWVQRPGYPEQQVPVECADATQDTYEYTGRSGLKAQLANFVHPAWFDVRLTHDSAAVKEFRSRGGSFDHAQRLSFAGDLSLQGYTIVREPTPGGGRKVWAEWGSLSPLNRAHAKAVNLREGSRSRTLGANLSQEV